MQQGGRRQNTLLFNALPCSKQVTELLYQKHTQLEHMAAEKAALQLTMEREITNAREYAERSHRLHLYPLQDDAA